MFIRRFDNPDQSSWEALTRRPVKQPVELESQVSNIMHEINMNGDAALRRLTQQFDEVSLENVRVSPEEIDIAGSSVPENLKKAIDQAYQNIARFHQEQTLKTIPIETMPGVTCWRETRPIESIGLYIPGGTAPLFSTVLMLGIPARIAGCHHLVLCTPPRKDGSIAPEILYAAQLCEIQQVFRVGGAQAIAAMTFGTQSIPKVQKIFGPGNQYVTEAKVQSQKFGISIDMPAGPSEVLVIADDTANPAFAAADMLSQAEHGIDSQVVLLSDSKRIIDHTLEELQVQLRTLPRGDIARKALEKSLVVSFDSIDRCIQFSNVYAPEHLILSVDRPRPLINQVISAGSVFLGHFSPEAVGDYASGTNHTLPTNGWARSYSGVSVDSFVKKITFQEISREGLKNIGGIVESMAMAESLIAHKRAVSIRLASD